MRKQFLVALLCVSFSASAQSFGELFPVTNTRYSNAFGTPRLTTNERDFFLFWGADGKTRVAKLQDGFVRGSHVALDSAAIADVTWTGERFLAVASKSVSPLQIFVRRLDAEARPAGPEITLANGGYDPRIAAGQNAALVLYRSSGTSNTFVRPLQRDGTPASEAQPFGSLGWAYDVASNRTGFLVVIAEQEDSIRAVTLDEWGHSVGGSTLATPRALSNIEIASDGTNYLAVWSTPANVVVAPLTANGNFGSPTVIDQSALNYDAFGNADVRVIWNGAGWTISYKYYRSSTNSVQSRIVHLDRSSQRILNREEVPSTGGVATAALEGRIMAAWNSGSVIELPIAEHTARQSSYAATRQTLLATASSATGTLIVWSEKIGGETSFHTGVRGHDGAWIERQLTSLPVFGGAAVAASDGEQFIVAIRGGSDLLYRLDATGRPLAAPIPLPFQPDAIAWNGTNYALMGFYSEGILLSRAGQLSTPIQFERAFSFETVASDGNGFFVAGAVMNCDFMLCNPTAVRGLRLGPDLQPIDSADLVFSQEYGETVTGAAWNGSEYVLLWQGEDSGKLARIPSSRAYPIETVSTNLPFRGENIAIMKDGSLAVTGRASDAKNHVALLQSNGIVKSVFEMDRDTNSNDEPRLEPLHAGGVAYIASSVQPSAPHDGIIRVMAAIAKPAIASPPDAPYVSARLENTNIVIDWSTPAGTVNGYRLEYRIDDDQWNEYEQWFGPGANRKTIRKPDVGTQFAFRLRAFNDGGASPYSATAVTKPSRRRAVR